MPVRGHGWYKRPYKYKTTFTDGHTQTKAYHWKGARDKDAEREATYSNVESVEVWDEPVDAVQVRR